MRYLYGEADEKFVKAPVKTKKKTPLTNFKFRLNSLTESKAAGFDKKDLPIVFKGSPNSLLDLCVKIIDAMPLPMVYTWNIEDICKWLRETGYKQYQNTFRVNLVNGRNLLLIDASALSAMNIKDFDHIKDMTRRIRSLFYFEMTKFGRSITLYPEFHIELYKLFRLKTGAKYNIRCSDLWRKMQLIRQNEPNYLHWDILERWLNFDKAPKSKEIVGGTHRSNLYACKTAAPKPQAEINVGKQCSCVPPCDCYWSKLERRRPWRLKCLPHINSMDEFVEPCDKCMPPCTCRWSVKKYRTHTVLSCLQTNLPNKYGGIFGQLRYRKYDQMLYRYSIIT